ncbi:MAG: DUF4381 domain-containing protein [Colwellia sp.]|uniref:DUF4381 domain-containing protein n=1 Tax=Colwellia sp. TaxID=56799 RepID=UPI0025BEFB27|nr:DUF4381 domain-containing protein [Colwellia sp.]NQZ25284.1 DUF4381 domain-containing protein [Colwellia sp.]
MSFEKPWGNYLLEAIVETKAPDTISFWPQTMAWQLILIVLIMFMLKKCYQAWQNYQANAYRREALAWLAQCSLTNEEDIRQLPALLRKTALLAMNGRQEITQLTGPSWAAWLDTHCSRSHFSEKQPQQSSSRFSCEKLLAQLAYMPAIDINDVHFNKGLMQLCQQIKLWITYHQLTITAELGPLGEKA